MDLIKKVKNYQAQHDFFVGIDSDGTVFDTMEIKHKQVLIPLAVRIWGLEEIEEAFYEVAEYINLYSNLRGTNRFSALVLTFKGLLNQEGINKDILPDFSLLQEFVDSKYPLSNKSLQQFIEKKSGNSIFLNQVLHWSKEGDILFAEYTEDIQPYLLLRNILEEIHQVADTMIVSSAPVKSLKKDWTSCDLMRDIDILSGQEVGEKKEQLSVGLKDSYPREKAIMIGDTPGDLKAARNNSILFYPIIPGKEEESWQLFYEEAMSKFLNGEYAGQYEDSLLSNFSK